MVRVISTHGLEVDCYDREVDGPVYESEPGASSNKPISMFEDNIPPMPTVGKVEKVKGGYRLI